MLCAHVWYGNEIVCAACLGSLLHTTLTEVVLILSVMLLCHNRIGSLSGRWKKMQNGEFQQGKGILSNCRKWLSNCEVFNKNWLGSLVLVRATSKGDTVCHYSCFPSCFIYSSTTGVIITNFNNFCHLPVFCCCKNWCQVECSLILEYFITHPPKKELDLLLKP